VARKPDLDAAKQFADSMASAANTIFDRDPSTEYVAGVFDAVTALGGAILMDRCHMSKPDALDLMRNALAGVLNLRDPSVH
jgi:hypothetical protein